MVDDDGAAIGERFHSMADIAGHDCDQASPDPAGNAVDGHLKLPINDLVDFFLRMEVFVDRRASREFVMRECHIGRVEISSMPAWQALDHFEAAGVDSAYTVR